MADQFVLGEATIEIRLERLGGALEQARREVEQSLSGPAFMRGMASFNAATDDARDATDGLLDKIAGLSTTASFGFGTAGQAAQRFTGILSRVTAVLATPTGVAVAGLTGLASGMALAAKEAAALDKAFEPLRVGFGLSEGQIDELKTSIATINPVLGEMTDHARALTLAVGKGFVPADGGAATIKFLEDTARFGRAIGQDPVRAMETMTEVLGAYGLRAEEADRVSRGLFQIGLKIGIQNLPGLINGIERLAPVAREAGIGMDEVTAALEQVAQSGLGAFRGTFALRQVLSTLTTQSEDFRKKFGIDLKKTIGEEGLVGAFRLLEVAIKNDADAQKALGIGFTEFNTILTVLKNNAEGYRGSLQNLRQPTVDLANITPTVGESFRSVLDSGRRLLAFFGGPLASGIKAIANDFARTASIVANFIIKDLGGTKPVLSEQTRELIERSQKIVAGLREQAAAQSSISKEVADSVSNEERLREISKQRFEINLRAAAGVRTATLEQAALDLGLARQARADIAARILNEKQLTDETRKLRSTARLEEIKAEKVLADATRAFEEQLFSVRRALNQVTLRDELAAIDTRLRAAKVATEQTIADEQRRAQIFASIRQQEESVGERLFRMAAERLKAQGREWISLSEIQTEAARIQGEAEQAFTGGFFRPEDVGQMIEFARLSKDINEVTKVLGGTAASAVRVFAESLKFGAPAAKAFNEELLKMPELKIPAVVSTFKSETQKAVDESVSVLETGLTKMTKAYAQFLQGLGPAAAAGVGAAGDAALRTALEIAVARERTRFEGLRARMNALALTPGDISGAL